jgi:hypothetical protein
LSVYVATEEEKAQALREAREQNFAIDTADKAVDPRKEKTQITDKYVGFLGEIVLCNRMHWQRLYPPKFGQPDAISPNGRTEIKTRTRHYNPIRVNQCDFAVLLFYSKNDTGEDRITWVKSYSKNYLWKHEWKIWISRKLWDYYLSR